MTWRASPATGVAPSRRARCRLGAAGRRPGPACAPLWSVLPGLVAAVLALVAALGFGASLEHLVSSPRLYGWDWDLSFDGFDLGNGPTPDVLAADPDLVALAPRAPGARCRSGGRLLPALGLSAQRGRPRGAGHRGPGPGRRRTSSRSALADLDALGRLRRRHRRWSRTSDGDERLRYRIVGRTRRARPQPQRERRARRRGHAHARRACSGSTPGAHDRRSSSSTCDPGAIDAVRDRYGSAVPGAGAAAAPRDPELRPGPLDPGLLAALLAFMGAGRARARARAVRARGPSRARRPQDPRASPAARSRPRSRPTPPPSACSRWLIGLPLGLAARPVVLGAVRRPPRARRATGAPASRLVGIVAAATVVLANLVAAVPARSAARTSPAIVLRTE